MITVLRVWPVKGVNVWWSTNMHNIDETHEHIALAIHGWESEAYWSKISNFTWKNCKTGERFELLCLPE